MKIAKKVTSFVVMAIVLIALIIGNVACVIFEPIITRILCGSGNTAGAEHVLQASDALCQEIAEEGIVMLKNDNAALPLSEEEWAINVFGYGAYDGFMLKGLGSGSSTLDPNKTIMLLDALEKSGIDYNIDIKEIYDDYTSNRPTNTNITQGNVYNLGEPAMSKFSQSVMEDAYKFSNVAMFVITRVAGENASAGEIPLTQSDNRNKTYLNITDTEEAMLDLICDTFDKVIVVLNTSNTMHAGFLNKYDNISALSVGLPGQSGAMAIASILKGQKEVELLDENGEPTGATETVFVSPSGKLTDTMVYSPEYDPSYVNVVDPNKSKNIQYVEDIYFGYKWYETADAEKYFDDVSNEYGNGYGGVVQYPFGYGGSYTTFDWEIVEMSDGDTTYTKESRNITLKADSEFTIKVQVTNVGDYVGRDVVELFYTPQYNANEIEKAEMNLLDFGKTVQTLDPDDSDKSTEIITLSFSAYDLASYDYNDKNKNDAATYEVDQGIYTLKLMTDAHTLKDCEWAEIELTVEEDIIFNTDPVSKQPIKNRFTGEDAYAGVPIDGSTVGITTKYLTRGNGFEDFPKAQAKQPNNTQQITKAANYYNPTYNTDTMPTVGKENDLRLIKTSEGKEATLEQLNGSDDSVVLEWNMELIKELVEDYNSDKWEDLLDQMTIAEMTKLVEVGGFQRVAVESIGFREMVDYDGPAGFNASGGAAPTLTQSTYWTAHANETLMGQTWSKTLMFALGRSMGAEGADTQTNGWYAPGINLHRSAYTARNFEYYSEDAILSGKLASEVVYGAKTNGLTCYVKHFACSESGPNPHKFNTWLTEQNLRENYLKPFEIVVKEGKANAIMTAFNRVGASWTGANYAMNVEVLREEWGFKGMLITDWAQGYGELGGMYSRQGIRAGNDLWLNCVEPLSGPLDRNDATDMTCARNAVHNILYASLDTLYTQELMKDQDLGGIQVETAISFKDDVFRWWIILLVALDVLVVGGFGAWTYVLVKPQGKENEDVQVSTNENISE